MTASDAQPTDEDAWADGTDQTSEPGQDPGPPVTGDPALDEMLRALASSSEVPLADQLPIIEAVHRGLQDRLADVEG